MCRRIAYANCVYGLIGFLFSCTSSVHRTGCESRSGVEPTAIEERAACDKLTANSDSGIERRTAVRQVSNWGAVLLCAWYVSTPRTSQLQPLLPLLQLIIDWLRRTTRRRLRLAHSLDTSYIITIVALSPPRVRRRGTALDSLIAT